MILTLSKLNLTQLEVAITLAHTCEGQKDRASRDMSRLSRDKLRFAVAIATIAMLAAGLRNEPRSRPRKRRSGLRARATTSSLESRGLGPGGPAEDAEVFEEVEAQLVSHVNEGLGGTQEAARSLIPRDFESHPRLLRTSLITSLCAQS